MHKSIHAPKKTFKIADKLFAQAEEMGGLLELQDYLDEDLGEFERKKSQASSNHLASHELFRSRREKQAGVNRMMSWLTLNLDYSLDCICIIINSPLESGPASSGELSACQALRQQNP